MDHRTAAQEASPNGHQKAENAAALNLLEIDNYEHELIASLVLQFAQSVEKPTKYQPEKTTNPIMFAVAQRVLEKMCVEYVPTKED